MRRRARNPLTKREVTMLRSAAATALRGQRPRMAVHKTYAMGLLHAIQFFAASKKARAKAARAFERVRFSGVRRSSNPLLQLVMPNGRFRSKTVKRPKGWRKPAWLRFEARPLRVVRADIEKRPWVKRSKLATAHRPKCDWVVSRGPVGEQNPLARRRSRGPRSGQRILSARIVSRREVERFPGFHANLALFRKFHGTAPSHFTIVKMRDGSPGHRRSSAIMVGEVPSLEYRTWRHMRSSKSHTRDGRKIIWRHKMGEHGGKPTYAVHDQVSGVTSLLGGTYRVAGKPAFYRH